MVRGTTHIGALGCFTQVLAKEGMVGVAFAASLPLMAYHGASEAIQMPGERGQQCHAQRMIEGIPLSTAVVKELSACARPEGLALPW
jgi:LDH2 family malate/lactate/ureidoglycolate dehydrogenase